MTKACSRCGTEYPATAEFFHRDRRKLDGLIAECKPCAAQRSSEYLRSHAEQEAERKRQWRLANRERLNAKDRAYQLEHRDELSVKAKARYEANRDERLEKMRAYRLEHLEEDRASSREWMRTHREQRRPYEREWQARHPELRRAREAARRARKRACEGRYTPDDVALQMKRQRGRCYWCDTPTRKEYHVDHVIPLARGGSNGPENIVIACPTCNVSKGAKLPHEWALRIA